VSTREFVLHAATAPPGAHVRHRLNEFLDRELAPDEESLVRRHLAECPACAGEHERLALAVGSLRGLGRERAPEGFASRVLRRVRRERRSELQRWSEATQKVPWEGGIAIILAAVAAMAVIGWSVVEKARPIVVQEAPAAQTPRAGPP